MIEDAGERYTDPPRMEDAPHAVPGFKACDSDIKTSMPVSIAWLQQFMITHATSGFCWEWYALTAQFMSLPVYQLRRHQMDERLLDGYLVRCNGLGKAIGKTHMWDGKDTLCRMWSTGGLDKRKRWRWSRLSNTDVCTMCLNVAQSIEERLLIENFNRITKEKPSMTSNESEQDDGFIDYLKDVLSAVEFEIAQNPKHDLEHVRKSLADIVKKVSDD